MELLQLRYFSKIAEKQSLTKAARELYTSQPSLSRMLKSLEDELGVQLFQRANRQVRLTRKGTEFLAEVQKALQIIDQAKAAVREDDKQQEIVIAMTYTSEEITHVLKRFHEIHPDIKLTITAPEDAINLTPRSFDLCVAISPVSHDGLRHLPLLREEMVLLISDRHRLAGAESVSLEELNGESFVLPPDGPMRYACDTLCSYAGFAPKIAAETHNYLSIQTYLTTGDCVAMRSLSVVTSFPGRDLRIVRISSPDPYQHVYLTWSADKPRSSAAETFSAFLCSELNAPDPCARIRHIPPLRVAAG